MITLNIYNQKGDSVGSVDINPDDFGGKVNKQLLHDVVVMHLANQRAGTHSTLRRGEVAGSTKKLFRQKGTGNARVGTRRTNKRKGGGTAKGPKPRDYEYHLPKKAVRLAIRMALLSKFQDNEAIIVDKFELPEAKTKHMAAAFKALKLKKGETCLVGIPKPDATLFKATRNLDGTMIFPVAEFNTYNVLRHKRLLLTRDALDALRANGGETKAAAAGSGK